MPSNTGSADLKALGIRMERLGSEELQKVVYPALERAAQGLRVDIIESARRVLPKAGGMADLVSAQPIYIRSKTNSKKDFSVFVIQTWKGHDLRSLNNGRLRHPVFGRRENTADWQNQKITPGYFTDAITMKISRIRKVFVKAANDALKGIEQ